MQLSIEKLNLFFSKIREITFWQRLFYWRSVRNLSYDAFEEFKALEKNTSQIKSDFDNLEKDYRTTNTKNEGLEKTILQFERLEIKKDSEINGLNKTVEELNRTISGLNISLSKFGTTEEERARNYENKITQLNQVKE